MLRALHFPSIVVPPFRAEIAADSCQDEEQEVADFQIRRSFAFSPVGNMGKWGFA